MMYSTRDETAADSPPAAGRVPPHFSVRATPFDHATPYREALSAASEPWIQQPLCE